MRGYHSAAALHNLALAPPMETSDFISGIATVAALWALLRTEQTRSTMLKAAWDQARMHRKRFWRTVRMAFIQSRHESWPSELSALVLDAGMPPNVPVANGLQIRDWYADNSQNFTVKQKRIWSFVEKIYPERSTNTVDLMDSSIVDASERELFDDSRRSLATFFHRYQEELSSRHLKRVAGHAFEDVILLSWLELALVRATQDSAPGPGGFQGKKGLYEFGNYLSRL